MKTTVKRITPDLAAKWLEGNTHNRNLRQSVVDKYARDMKEGHWRPTHQGIAFDSKGVLIDGQHRLWAILQSGVTLDLMVTEGLDMEAQEVIDGGEVRQSRDVLTLRGEQGITTVVVGMAKELCIQLTGNWSPTRSEVVEMYETYKDAIQFAARTMPKRVKGIWKVPVLLPLARAYYSQDRTKLQSFAQVLVDGMMNDPQSDKPIVMLRNFLMEKTAKRSEQYAKTERALHAYLHGEKIAMLYAAGEELFLLPVEERKLARRKKKSA